MLLFVLNDGPLAPNAIVRCNDEFVRVDDGEWRFSRRSLSVVAGKV